MRTHPLAHVAGSYPRQSRQCSKCPTIGSLAVSGYVPFSIPQTASEGYRLRGYHIVAQLVQARHGCDFSNGATGPETCLTGGCNGGLECDAHTGTVRRIRRESCSVLSADPCFWSDLQGIPPATLAEFTLGINGAADSYDGEEGHIYPYSVLSRHPSLGGRRTQHPHED